MKLSDPALQKAFDEVQNLKEGDQEAFNKWAGSLDLSELNDEDMNEIFYALGPVSISNMIKQMLTAAKEADDVEYVAAISAIRHVMFTPKTNA